MEHLENLDKKNIRNEYLFQMKMQVNIDHFEQFIAVLLRLLYAGPVKDRPRYPLRFFRVARITFITFYLSRDSLLICNHVISMHMLYVKFNSIYETCLVLDAFNMLHIAYTCASTQK